MATRPAPFGTFSGVSAGRIGTATHLKVPAAPDYRRRTSIDMRTLRSIADSARAQIMSSKEAVVRINPTAYIRGPELRFVMRRELGDDQRQLRLVGTPLTPALEAIIRHLSVPRTISSLGAFLRRSPLALPPSLVDELVQAQIIVPTLDLSLTGDSPLLQFAEQLMSHSSTQEQGVALQGIAVRLTELDSGVNSHDPAVYERIRLELQRSFNARVTKPICSVALAKPAPSSSLAFDVADSLLAGARILSSVTPARVDPDLEVFVEAFAYKYGEAHVRLCEALDPEFGIGFGRARHPTPGLEALPQPRARRRRSWTARDHLLHNRIAAWRSGPGGCLQLSDDDLARLADATVSRGLPRTFAVYGRLLASSGRPNVASEQRLIIESVGGPSGIETLSRFAYEGGEAHELVAEHIEAEEALDPDTIYAEVVHTPNSRDANVLVRPQLRRWEIPYIDSSGAPAAAQLALDDLVVSVRNRKVTLYSSSTGRTIRPRQASPHAANASHSPVYRFLCALACEELPFGLAWDWGALRYLSQLPRVTYGELILAPALWNVSRAEFTDPAPTDDDQLLASAQSWRRERDVPRLVEVVDGDRSLLVDFGCSVSISSFMRLLTVKGSCTLHEVFLDADDLVACGPQGRYVHDLVVPFVEAHASGHGGVRTERIDNRALDVKIGQVRQAYPSSQWLSFNLFCGVASADEVLARCLRPALADLRQEQLISSWFFIRYGDEGYVPLPDWHIRWRLLVTSRAELGRVQDLLRPYLEDALNADLLWRCQIDTYIRDLHTLGGPGTVDLMERYFELDSDFAIEVVSARPHANAVDGGDGRLLVAILGAHCILEDFGLSLSERLSLIKGLRSRLARGLGTVVDTRLIGSQFRDLRTHIEAMLYPEGDGGVRADYRGLIEQRSAGAVQVVHGLRRQARLARSTQSIHELLGALLHLHFNRLVRYEQRRSELLAYEYMSRLYRSRLARS